MYVVWVELEISPDQMGHFMPLMQANAASSRQNEPGCLQFDVIMPEDLQHTVLLYEMYQDASAFAAHLQTAHFKTFDQATAHMITGKRIVTGMRRFPEG